MGQAHPKNYQESDFTTEIMRWLNPYEFKNELIRDPETGEPVWCGQVDWHAWRLKDDNYQVVAYQRRKPFDLHFAVGVPGGGNRQVLEFHALELKLQKSYSYVSQKGAKAGELIRKTNFSQPFSDVAGHQFEGLRCIERMGINGFAWLVVQFRDYDGPSRQMPTGRETWAIRFPVIERMERQGKRSISLEECQRYGVQLHHLKLPGLVKLPKTKTRPAGIRAVKLTRNAWELSPLVYRERKRGAA